ncbi:uncharacterized protein BDZ99DRAFT_526021 [Mytilinidion resinicola]|uniref:Uncharacterized protein n=1 Tax=Mytilinidion resinicola TaxID=574789 RepID=A0A6A6Y5P5_9PEZI|nr:uncharacterized protein BDZ99DRAFT_526021 [Mytilinidion resinicola]KAF2803980.1 hypothetical protein BDZ99DRAFT_526021 [Mytilinidion resinicola]
MNGYNVGPVWEDDELAPFPPLTDGKGKKVMPKVWSERDSDSFAWYAMAMWAKDKIGGYPPGPEPDTKPPTQKPRHGNNHPRASGGDTPEDPERGAKKYDYVPDDGFTILGCPDKDIGHSSRASLDPPAPDLDSSIDASNIPSSIFSSDTNKVYKTFCSAASLITTR